jgi:hypothetical protein
VAAASSTDVQKLVTRMRGKGLDDSQVTESLRGMGYSKRDAAAAVQSTSTGSSSGSSTRAGGQAGGPTAQAGAAGGNPASGTGSSSGSGSPTLASFAPSIPSVSPTLTPPKRLNGGDLAGFMTGLLLYTLALNYIRFGKSGVTGWLSAKFLNRVTVGASTSGASWGQQTLTPQAGTAQARSGLTSTRPRTRKV